jgi:uncharacterized RDD family membrane protein YckC
MPICPQCGTQNNDSAAYCQACGRSLTAAATPAPSAQQYAGFWTRLAAWVIDIVIVYAVSGLVIAGTFGIGILAVFLLPWVYEAWLLSSDWQATVGKRALGMRVIDLQGRRITFARASGRHFAKYISAFLLGIGFIMAAFTSKKQALHDMLAETLVILDHRV